MDLFEFADLNGGRHNDRERDHDHPLVSAESASMNDPATAENLERTPVMLRDSVVTLTDALNTFEKMPGVSGNVVADCRSAVATFARVSGRDPDAMPIAPREMVPILKSVRPGLHRVKAKRWANVRSSLARLAAAVGWHAPRERMLLEVTGEWAALLATLSRSPQKANLSGFARYCQTEGIAPGEVTEATIDGYLAWRSNETYDLWPKVTVHGVRRIWNAHAGQVSGWPDRKLRAPKDPRVIALPLAEFPETFARELDSFFELLREPDPFDKNSRRRRLAETTLHDRRSHVIRAASILVLLQQKTASEITGLHVLAEPTAMKAVLRFHFERAGRVWHHNALETAIAIRDIARYWLKLDASALASIDDLYKAVKPPRQGIGQRSLRRLQPFDDPLVLKRFFKLPGDLFKAADELVTEDRHVQAAHLHEKALALAIVQLQPLRRRTLAVVDIEKHLLRDARGRIVSLSMPGSLVKNGVDISAPIPDDLARRLDKHIRVHLPRLKGERKSDWLFPGDTPQGHKNPCTLAKQVAKEVENALGIEFSLHMVRHVAASVLYASSPDAGPVAQRLLAHRHLSTTETFYGRVKTRSAHRDWGQILDDMRAKDRKKASGGNKRGGKGGTS